MPNKEQIDWTTRLKELYNQLLRISQEQQALLLNHVGNEQFGERFAELAGEWDDIQNEILHVESELKETVDQQQVKSFFDANLAAIIETIQETIRETEAGMKREILDAGKSLRNFREHQHAKQAYAEPDIGLHSALYVDEKK